MAAKSWLRECFKHRSDHIHAGIKMVIKGAAKLLFSGPHPLVYPVPSQQTSESPITSKLQSLLHTVITLHCAPYPIQSLKTRLWVLAMSLTPLIVQLICRIAGTSQNRYIVQCGHECPSVNSRTLKRRARHWAAAVMANTLWPSGNTKWLAK